MTYERFLQIKEEYKDIDLDKTRLWNISSNARCYRSRFSTKGTDDEDWFESLIDMFNADGNEYITNERGIQHITATQLRGLKDVLNACYDDFFWG